VFPRPNQLKLIYILVLLAGCSVQVNSEGAATTTPFIITATLPATLTPLPSESPVPPPPQPTVAPVQGAASTQINVRMEPSIASEVLGIIPANTAVEIIGKDLGENWWQIIYPAGVEGKGWVAAQYITTASKPEVPVVGGGESNPGLGNSAVVIQQLNIRSGPGTNFNSIGILNTNDVVKLTGKNNNGSWLQIEFAEGPEGRGWVNTGFVKADAVDGLPIISDVGDVIGTGTPVDTPLPAAPTLVPASMDNDSADNPIKTVILEDAGTHTVLYNGDVSAPNGDIEDWVSVTSYDDIVFVGIQCLGSGSVDTEITGRAIRLNCNEPMTAIPIQRNTQLLIHIKATATSSQLQYTNYTLTIKANP